MKSIRQAAFKALLVSLVLAGLATSGVAQVGTNDATIRDLVRRIETRTASLQRAVQNASDRNSYRVEDLNRAISDFETATNQLDRRLSWRRATSSDVRT